MFIFVLAQSLLSVNSSDVIWATVSQLVVCNFIVNDDDEFTVTLEGTQPNEEDYSLTQNGN